jgi:hypothetical protein
MKYIAPFFALIAAPVHAHSGILPHAHEVSFTPLLAGLSVIAIGSVTAFRYARGAK